VNGPALAQALDARMEARASPALIAFAGLLAATETEVVDLAERQIAANPALVRRVRPATCAVCAGRRCPYCEGARRREPRRNRPDWPDPPASSRVIERGWLIAEAACGVRASDRTLLEQVVAALDGRGLLRPAAREALAATDEAVDRVVAALRQVGPVGVAAANVRECLALQIDHLGPDRIHPLARDIVALHLEAVADGRLADVARALVVSQRDVMAALHAIQSRLRPFALADGDDDPLAGAPAPPALPEVLVLHHPDRPDRLIIDVVERRRLGIAVDDTYRRLAAIDADVADHVAAAQAFLDGLEHRWSTLRAIATEVVRVQREWIVGRGELVAHTRAAVAMALGVHESTVSRATAGRHLMLPHGRVVPFAYLFPRAPGAKAALARLVTGEDGPRSDGALSAALAALGYRVARRTVAKYRAELGIPPVSHRVADPGGLRLRLGGRAIEARGGGTDASEQ
jgi:RNA polymerase sigma-54 factor